MANWQGTPFTPSISQFSTLKGEIENIPREIITSSIYVSSIYISSMGQFNDLSGYQLNVSSLFTANISSIFGDFTVISLSTLAFNPQFSGTFSPKIDLGMGGFFGNLLGSLGSGALSVGLGAGGLATGIMALALPRGNKQINNAVYETINGTTQLQISTLGTTYPLYSSIFRTVSSVSANQVPGSEILVSSFFLPGTTCIRSVSDPLDLPVDIYFGSTIQSFGEWVPIQISTGGGSYTPTPTFSNVDITYQNEPGLAISKIGNINFSTGYAVLPPSVQVPNLTTLSSFFNHYSAVSQYNLNQITFSTGDVSVLYGNTFSTLTNFQMNTGTYDTCMISQLTDDFLQQKQLAGLNFHASTIGFGVSSFQSLTGTAPIQFQMNTQFNCNVIINNISTTNITTGNNINIGNNLFGKNAYFSGEIQASSLNILQTISTILTDTDLLNVSSLNADFISCGTATFSTLTIGKTVFGDLEGSNIYVDDVLRLRDPTSAGKLEYDFFVDYQGGSPTSNLVLGYLSSTYTDTNILEINGQSNFLGIGKTPTVALDVVGSINTTGNLTTQNINAQIINATVINSVGSNNFNAVYTGPANMASFQSLRNTILPLQQVQVSNVSCNSPAFQWNFFSTNVVEWTSTIGNVQAIVAGINKVQFWDLPNAQIDLINNTSSDLEVDARNALGNFVVLVNPDNFPPGATYRITLSPSGANALSNPPPQTIPYANYLTLYNDKQNYYLTDSGTTYPGNGLYITPPLYLENVQQFGARARVFDVNSVSGFNFINTGFLPFQISGGAGFGGGTVTAQTTISITTQLPPPGGGSNLSTFVFHADDWLPIVLPYSQDSSVTSVGFNSLQIYPQSSGGIRPYWQVYLRTVVNAIAGSMNWTVGGYMVPRTLGRYSWS